MQALFPSGRPLVVLPADVDSNPDNYEDGQLLEDASALQSLQLPIYRGMRLVFTRNVRKDLDYVNGMDGKVLSFDPSTQALEVLTATGFRVMVWPWTDVERGDLTYYPIKAGYADKIMKFQGAELTHVTAFLDRAGIPGAAYTALNRQLRQGLPHWRPCGRGAFPACGRILRDPCVQRLKSATIWPTAGLVWLS